MKADRCRERLDGMAAGPLDSMQEYLSAFLKAETALWAKVIKDSNNHAD